jgi:hypothetical protein
MIVICHSPTLKAAGLASQTLRIKAGKGFAIDQLVRAIYLHTDQVFQTRRRSI